MPLFLVIFLLWTNSHFSFQSIYPCRNNFGRCHWRFKTNSIINACILGCPEKQQVAQKNSVSYMWVNIYFKRHQTKFGEFSGFFEERPPIFVFTPIFQKNKPVIRVLTIFLTHTFQILFFLVHSRGQCSWRPDELNNTLHGNIALPNKLHAHAI